MKNLQDKIKKFHDLSREIGLKQIDPYGYELLRPDNKISLSISGIIHGNEVGGLEVLIRLLTLIKEKSLAPKINLKFMLGNVEAYLQEKRFVETDLNRSFQLENPRSMEEKRAVELEKLVANSNFHIDIHQTIEPIENPFIIFAFTQKNISFARCVSADLPIITYKNFSSAKVGKSLSATASSYSASAITVELGQKGWEEKQVQLGLSLVQKAIHLIENQEIKEMSSASWSNCFTWGQTVLNEDFSLELTKTYKNFDYVKTGELIAQSETHKVYAEVDGPVLFPKYGINQKQSKELVRVLRAIKSESDLT